ncbi:MAG: hypothetical protein WCQ00_04205 [bacterium]
MTNINEFIEKQRIEYYRLKSVRSIVFLNQEVFFTKSGFEHLIRKGLGRRSIPEKIRRLGLLKYTTEILQDYTAKVEYRSIEDTIYKKHYWGITKDIGNIKIKVVIRRIDNGKLTFLSIMNYGKGK